MDIANFYRVDEKLATSGQPTRDQLGEIATQGYDMVVNLSMPDSDNAVPDEGDIVAAAGMDYVHLPVAWENPRRTDVEAFFSHMEAATGKRVWVHCAKNKRASAFVYLYRRLVLGLPEEEALFPMADIWTPTGKWARLIETMLE